MEIRENAIGVWMAVGVFLLTTWGFGTIAFLWLQAPLFFPIFLYAFGSIVAFILLNIQYRWVKVK